MSSKTDIFERRADLAETGLGPARGVNGLRFGRVFARRPADVAAYRLPVVVLQGGIGWVGSLLNESRDSEPGERTVGLVNGGEEFGLSIVFGTGSPANIIPISGSHVRVRLNIIPCSGRHL